MYSKTKNEIKVSRQHNYWVVSGLTGYSSPLGEEEHKLFTSMDAACLWAKQIFLTDRQFTRLVIYDYFNWSWERFTRENVLHLRHKGTLVTEIEGMTDKQKERAVKP